MEKQGKFISTVMMTLCKVTRMTMHTELTYYHLSQNSQRWGDNWNAGKLWIGFDEADFAGKQPWLDNSSASHWEKFKVWEVCVWVHWLPDGRYIFCPTRSLPFIPLTFTNSLLSSDHGRKYYFSMASCLCLVSKCYYFWLWWVVRSLERLIHIQFSFTNSNFSLFFRHCM
jgi:hypothetical protein